MHDDAPRPVPVPELGPTGPAWSQCVVHGATVYVSGQVALDASGKLLGDGSPGSQTDHVFRNLERALHAAGSSLDRLARITIYVIDAAAIPEVRVVRDRWLSGISPASTLVIVAGLVEPFLVVEIDAVAALRA